jgi:Fe2+ transport system protein FeoA
MVEMGLAPGVRFSVVASGRPGPFILQLKDTRLVVGREMTDRLFVRPV